MDGAFLKPRNEREANEAAYSPSKIFDRDACRNEYMGHAGVIFADGNA